MEEAELREELAALEAEEARVSAERRHLHRQIDFGFASDATRAREREISDQRRQLHRRIDKIRELLGLPVGPGSAASVAPVNADLSLDTGEGQRLGFRLDGVALEPREPAPGLEREFRLGSAPGSDDLAGDEQGTGPDA
jgi:hypothetical protein